MESFDGTILGFLSQRMMIGIEVTIVMKFLFELKNIFIPSQQKLAWKYWSIIQIKAKMTLSDDKGV